MKIIATAFAIAALLPLAGAAATTQDAIIADPPIDAAHPAAMVYVRIPSQGALLNGVIYTAAGGGAHPTVLLLHGFPGNEQNLDLAQAMRRAGFSVLTFHFRGSWGSPGAFTFSHAAEDADAAVSFLRDPAIAAKFGIDPAHIWVAGHSMGGFLAASAAAHDRRVAGLVMISAWDMVGAAKGVTDPRLRADLADDVIPLGGATVDGLLQEIAADPPRWDYRSFAATLASRPVLLITADDGSEPGSKALEERLHAAGDHDVTEIHMTTDHPYSDHRIALESATIKWLLKRR